jgi:Uma2 family endonuclease
MSEPAHRVYYSFSDYVAFERTSNVKHEFFAGRIYAMAGGTPEHAALAAALSGLLYVQLRSGTCRVYSSDLRVRAGDLVTYPDVTVVCGPLERDPEDENTARNPTLVVEVTSPSTEEYDRGEKLECYQQIPGLNAVLIASHRKPLLELWQRHGTSWTPTSAGPGERLELSATGSELRVDDVYRGVLGV